MLPPSLWPLDPLSLGGLVELPVLGQERLYIILLLNPFGCIAQIDFTLAFELLLLTRSSAGLL